MTSEFGQQRDEQMGWWRKATTGQWRLSKEDSSGGADTEYGVRAFSIN